MTDGTPHWWAKLGHKWKDLKAKRNEGRNPTIEETRPRIWQSRIASMLRSSFMLTSSLSSSFAEMQTDKEEQEEEEGKMTKLSQSYFRFLELPRELRDEVYRHLFSSPHPIAVHDFCIEHDIDGHRYVADAHRASFPMQVLLTCRQIHDEGIRLFYQDNSWTLLTAPFFEFNAFQASFNSINEHLLDKSMRHQATVYIRVIDIAIRVAPVFSRTRSEEGIRCDKDIKSMWVQRCERGMIIARPETDDFNRAQLVLSQLALVQQDCFPRLQSIIISLHLPAQQGFRRKRYLRLRIEVKLQQGERQDTPAIPIRHPGLLEPQRRFLTPLALLGHVHCVDVRRHEVDDTAGSVMDRETTAPKKPRSQPVRTFTSIRAMLDAAGTNFENFEEFETRTSVPAELKSASQGPGISEI